MRNRLLTMLLLVGAIDVFAGGFLTNTNQSAMFNRNLSRDGVIAIDGVYSNPAGVAFLSDGFHLSLNIQNAHQTRTIVSTFEPFKYGVNNNQEVSKRFKGKADAPVIPSFQLAYNFGKWSLSSSFAITGGGGKCTFPHGLGSFEANAALLPLLGSALGVTGYDMDSYMRGRQYYYGLQVGASRKITDNLSVFAGVRGVYASCNYYGYLRDIKINTPGGLQMASPYFANLSNQAIGAAAQALAANMPEMAAAYQAQAITTGTLAAATQDITLNCDQTTFGITPIIGIDWKINEHWNLAAKYEFKTRIRLKNEAANSASADNLTALEQFKDGKKIAEDIPALLTLGAQYSPIESVRLTAGYHYFYDRQATKYGHTEKQLSRGTREISAGFEYDFNKHLTASCSWQNTNYGLTDEYMHDISFTTSSNSVGMGIQYRFNDKIKLDFGCFHTFYNSYDVNRQDFNNVSSIVAMAKDQATADALVASGQIKGKDHYLRTNRVMAIGVTFDF